MCSSDLSRIPRPSVPASSPNGAGATSKVAVTAGVSKMTSALEKKQGSTSLEEAPPVVYNNTRVSFAPEDEEKDSSKQISKTF